MGHGVGGVSEAQALAGLHHMMDGVQDIGLAEYRERIARLQATMREQGVDAVLLYAGTSLRYFTGFVWRASERLVGALVPAQGELQYIAPWFETGTVQEMMVLPGRIQTWHEHESPYALVAQLVSQSAVELGKALNVQGQGLVLAIDDSAPFFVVDGLRRALPGAQWQIATPLVAPLRQRKSAAELALMQRAFDMTLRVHQATASMLREGMSTTEVEAFIQAAHRKVGASGSSFCIVLFGVASSFPHGVKEPQVLKAGDVVLIDTGCYVHGYTSDITRSYVFGEASQEVRRIWDAEKAAQAAAFAAAKLGAPCEAVDAAARDCLAQHGLGPAYALPGLPHRTGHGIGLDIHESPYLVGGDRTPLAPGMCFSNEPMIVVPGQFGIRLEDHFYMTEQGPRWFTQPSHSLDDPFGLLA